MRIILAAIALVLGLPQFSAAQSTSNQTNELSIGFAGGPKGYVSGSKRRTGALQLFARGMFTPTFGCEVELAGGGGDDGDIYLPGDERGTPVITHFAADLGVNFVYRTPGRVGFVATAGPALYVEQRDTELRNDSDDDPQVLSRDNDYTFGAQASAGVDVKFRSAALFSVLRYEARALRAPDTLANWQVLIGVRFAAPW